MTDRLCVLLDDMVVGTISKQGRRRLHFDYAEDYRGLPGATPLSVSMPTEISSHPDHVIGSWIRGLLPDDDTVLRRWASRFHVPATPLELLATPVGEDCAGAVRFAKPEDSDRILAARDAVTWLTDEDVAQLLSELREDASAWLGSSFRGQFSLAGAQAKTALLHQDGQWGIPSGSLPTTHVLKPAIPGLDDHDLNEHLCLDAARRAGLPAVFTRIARFGDESAVVVERYDRVRVGDQIVRIHQEDLCQALSVRHPIKYQNEGGPTPRDVVALLRRVMPAAVAEDSVRLFADALIWNWLIGGADAHAKNYSLMLAGPVVRLAPLYDIASALPYGDHEKSLRLAMKIGDDYRIYTWHNAWPRAARNLGIDEDELVDRVRHLAGIAPDAFADAARHPEVAGLQKEMPSRLVDLIAERAPRCGALLDARVRE
jgi:serine/threonine-protein kinase HipA